MGVMTPMYQRDSRLKKNLKNESKQKSQLAKNNPTLHIKFEMERSAMGRHMKPSDETIVPLGQNLNTNAASSTDRIGLEMQKD